jgi:hypothetical protein
LLAGEKIVILASQQRTPTGIDLLNKLNKLRVVKRIEEVQWTTEIERFFSIFLIVLSNRMTMSFRNWLMDATIHTIYFFFDFFSF